MAKKVMTKKTYTEVIKIKGAVQMLGSVVEGLEKGAVLGAVDSAEDAIDIIIDVYNEQLKTLNEMLIEKGLMKDESDSNSIDDIMNNTIIIGGVK